MLIATMEEKRATRTGKLLLLLAFLLFIPLGAVAQIITVKGTVIDSQGETVIGASVVEKGNVKNATITDLDGNFTLKVTKGKLLVISFVGMETQEVKAAPKLNITMQDDA